MEQDQALQETVGDAKTLPAEAEQAPMDLVLQEELPRFIGSDSWTGARQGYYFGTGESGLGYYRDEPRQPLAEIPLSSQASFRQGDTVTAAIDFRTDCMNEYSIQAGMRGVIQQIDSDGDADIKFEGCKELARVFKRNFDRLNKECEASDLEPDTSPSGSAAVFSPPPRVEDEGPKPARQRPEPPPEWGECPYCCGGGCQRCGGSGKCVYDDAAKRKEAENKSEELRKRREAKEKAKAEAERRRKVLHEAGYQGVWDKGTIKFDICSLPNGNVAKLEDWDANTFKLSLDGKLQTAELTAGGIKLHWSSGSTWRRKAAPVEASPDEEPLPTNAEDARNRGTVHFQAGRFDQALTLYQHASKLDATSVLAMSNASESCLRLGRPKDALGHAQHAFALDSSHKKTWLRYGKALAMLDRAAEAYVWIADRVADFQCEIDDTILDIFVAIGKASPFCITFHRGLYIERYGLSPGISVEKSVDKVELQGWAMPAFCKPCDDGKKKESFAAQRQKLTGTAPVKSSKPTKQCGYRIRTAFPIKHRTTLCEELPVVPWDSKCLYNQERFGDVMDSLASGLAPGEISTIPKINGIAPRTWGDIPFKTSALTDLEDRVNKYLFNPETVKECLILDEEKIQSIVRCFAASKISGHIYGIYHFGSFFNHSCAPDCEVINTFKTKHSKVVTMRDIEAGAEICITYLQVDYSDGIGALHLLDLPVMCRTLSFERQWGEACYCTRCKDEIDAFKAKGQQESDHGEAAFVEFQKAVSPMMNDSDEGRNKYDFPIYERILTFWKDGLLAKDEILKDWDTCPWKETFLLANYSRRLEEFVDNVRNKFPKKCPDEKVLTKQLSDMHEALEKYRAVKNLMRLLDKKHAYLRPGSFSHQPVYKVFLEVMKNYIATKHMSTAEYNQQNFMRLYQNVKVAQQLSEDLIEG